MEEEKQGTDSSISESINVVNSDVNQSESSKDQSSDTTNTSSLSSQENDTDNQSKFRFRGGGGNPDNENSPLFLDHGGNKGERNIGVRENTPRPGTEPKQIPISVAINNLSDPITRIIVSRVPRHLLGSYCATKTPGNRNDQKMCLQSIKEAFKESAQRSLEEWKRENSLIEMHRPHELGILTLGLDGLMHAVNGFIKGFMNDAKLAWKEGFYRHIQRYALIRAIKRLDLLDDFHEKKFANYANVMNEQEGAALYRTVLAKHGGDEAVKKIYAASKGSAEIVQNIKKDFENMTVRDMVNHAVKHAEPEDLQHILHAATRIILEHGGVADYSIDGDISKYADPNVASFEGKMVAVNLHDKLNDDSMKGKLSFDDIAKYLNDAVDVKKNRKVIENVIDVERFRQLSPAKRIEAIDSPEFSLAEKIAHMRHLMTVLEQNGKGDILNKPISSIKTHQEVEHHLISDAKRFIDSNLLEQLNSQDKSNPTDTKSKPIISKLRDIISNMTQRPKNLDGSNDPAPG